MGGSDFLGGGKQEQQGAQCLLNNANACLAELAGLICQAEIDEKNIVQEMEESIASGNFTGPNLIIPIPCGGVDMKDWHKPEAEVALKEWVENEEIKASCPNVIRDIKDSEQDLVDQELKVLQEMQVNDGQIHELFEGSRMLEVEECTPPNATYCIGNLTNNICQTEFSTFNETTSFIIPEPCGGVNMRHLITQSNIMASFQYIMNPANDCKADLNQMILNQQNDIDTQTELLNNSPYADRHLESSSQLTGIYMIFTILEKFL